MPKPNDLHHLAIATADIKTQIEFFSDVLGMELVALYWMHGVDGCFHGFMKLHDRASIAFVQRLRDEIRELTDRRWLWTDVEERVARIDGATGGLVHNIRAAFEACRPVATIEVRRFGEHIRTWRIFLCRNYHTLPL